MLHLSELVTFEPNLGYKSHRPDAKRLLRARASDVDVACIYMDTDVDQGEVRRDTVG